MWAVRRSISPSAFRIRPNKFAEDISVPRSTVAQAIEQAHAIGREHGLPMLCFGHLGDGNIHVNIMHDGSVQAELVEARAAKDKIFHMAVALGWHHFR